MRFVKALGGVSVSTAAILAAAPSAHAQPAIDRVLSDVEIEQDDQCAVLQVNFNFPVRLVSSFPLEAGDALRIRVRAIDEREHGEAMQNRESVRAPENTIADINSIDFEGDRPDGPTLNIAFASSEHFQVGQGQDFRSIRIAMYDEETPGSCTPDFHPVTAAPEIIHTPPPRSASAADVGANDPLLSEARAAMTAGDNQHAVQLLTRILQDQNSPSAQNAQELLGLARERNGQLAHARAEYEEYLRRFPTGEESDRVRQRLAVLLASEVPGQPELRPASQEARAGGAQWEANASLSQFYFRDENRRTFEEPFGPPNPTTEAITNQDELLTALDLDVALETNSVHARMRASGGYTNDFIVDGRDQGSISALYLEIGDAEDRLVTRIGRQTRSSAGILGRFDGALTTLQATRAIRLGLTAGYPVDTPHDLSFDPHRFFYGANIEFQGEKWNLDLYGVNQTDHDMIDRQAAGVEVRYVSDHANAFAMVDYDVHYNELNIGLINTSLTLPDETTLNFGYDYRRAPSLATINALIGQTLGSLDELRFSYTDTQIEQLALDRSAVSSTAFVGIAHPFSEQLSINADATVATLDATPASGGVPATEATDNELYASVQLVGASLLKEGDLGIVGLRYADTASSVRYGLDISTRYPVTESLRLNPRFRLNFRENNADDGTQLAARPSMRLDYRAGRHLSVELEAGAEWQRTESSMIRDESWDYFITAGYRLDF